MAMNFQEPRAQVSDTNGKPMAGAKLRFYEPGTTTPRAVYSDDGLSTAITQPVVADSAGRFQQIFLQTGTYRVKLFTSSEVLVYDDDDVDPSLSTNSGALAVANGGTGATTAAGARANLDVPSQSAFDSLEVRVDDVEATLSAPILAVADTLTFATSLTPVFTTFETRVVTATDNFTLNAATVTDGQKWRLFIIQDATGNRTWTVNSAYKFHSNIVPPLSTSANAVDELWGYVRGSRLEVEGFKRQDVLSNIAILEDQKSSGTDGGTFTSGADRTRDLNTEVSDLSGLVSISANQFIIANAGTYEISWSAPAQAVDDHQSWLYNITSAAVAGRGSSERSGTDTASRSVGSAIIVLSATATFEIRHRCLTTRATDGFGEGAGLGTEVFTRVVIRKIQ